MYGLIAIFMTFVVPALIFILIKRVRGQSYEEIVGDKKTFSKSSVRNLIIFIIAVSSMIVFAILYIKYGY